MSLAGKLGIRSDDRLCDADAAVNHAATFIDVDEPPLMVGPRIVTDTLKRKTKTAPLPWKCKTPTLAVIGVGVLAGQHRLLHAENKDAFLPAKEEVAQVHEYSKIVAKEYASDRPDFCPVGDVTNRMFLVDPFDRYPSSVPDSVKRLDAAIRAWNQRVLAPRFSQLNRVADRGALVAVAGGPLKQEVIRFILKHRNDHLRRTLNLTHLVCDDRTAEWLIEHLPEETVA
jgi:hypothetical protein